MTSYQVRFLNRGKYVWATEAIECASDEEALYKASFLHRRSSAGEIVEVWDEDRLVTAVHEAA